MTRRLATLALATLAVACDQGTTPQFDIDDTRVEFRGRSDDDDDDDGDCFDFSTVSVSKSFKDVGQFLVAGDWSTEEPYSSRSDEWRSAYDENIAVRAINVLEADFLANEETPALCDAVCNEVGGSWTGHGCPIAADVIHDDAMATLGYLESPVWTTQVEAVVEFGCTCG